MLKILEDGTFWTAAGVILAAISLWKSTRREKKQATLDAFIAFKKDVKEFENEIHNYSKEDVQNIIKEHEANDNTRWDKVKIYLMKIEQIAVGVNSRIYSVWVINRMGGYFLYEQYMKMKPIIKYKRGKDDNNLIYKEFEKMLNKIRICRMFSKGPNFGKVGKC